MADLRGRPRRARAERGDMTLVGGAVIVLLVAATLVLGIPLTQGLSSRRASATAADAAALAAAQEWSRGFERMQRSLEVADDAAFWAFPGRPVDAVPVPRLRSEAADLAAANDADLISLSLDARRLEVTVRVRMRDEAIPGTGIRMEHAATADVDLRRGLCARSGRMGYLVGGSCLSTPQPAPPAVRPPLGAYRADVLRVR